MEWFCERKQRKYENEIVCFDLCSSFRYEIPGLGHKELSSKTAEMRFLR
jgi:hypothetical protein